MGLRVKIPLLIGLVVLISSIAIIVAVERVVSKKLQETINSELNSEARVNTELVHAMVDTELSQLWEIANRARTRSMNWSIIRESLIPDVERINSLDIGLVLPDGTPRYVVDTQNTTNMGDRDYVMKAFTGENSAAVLMSRTTNSLVTMFAAPVFQNDEPGASIIGVLVARKHATALNNLIGEIKSEYGSGHAILVDREGTFIAHPDSRLVERQFNPMRDAQNDPSLKSIGDMVAAALRERSGLGSYVYEGKEMICSFKEVSGHPWMLFFTMERDELLARIVHIRFTMVAIGTICAIAGIIIAIIIGGSIARPVIRMAAVLESISGGDLTTRINDMSDRKDELGTLGKTVNDLASRLQSIMKNLRINSDTLAGASEELSAVSRQLASCSEETVAQSQAVASTAEEMAVNINSMASGAEEASVNAGEVAGAAEEMSVNMDTITGSMEKMSESIHRISENTTGVQKVAAEAKNKAADATGVMSSLGSAAKEIGHVTDIIKKIADKTNLLALNATIEAASAGEAGKGFAVVAGEIKELANQSAQSADDITRRIEDIQSGTNNAVRVIQDVSDIIIKINQSVEAISDNVKHQNRAGSEITNNVAQANTGARRVASAISDVAHGASDLSRNAGEAAKGAAHVSGSVADMNQVARDSAQGAVQVNQSAAGLAEIAEELRQTVAHFKL